MPAKKRVRPRIRLVHWDVESGRRHVLGLEDVGYSVDATPFMGPASLRALRENPPDVVLIDLDRRPSSGRDVAMALRHARSTRHVPLVFAGGPPEKIQGIRSQIPDAVYTPWRTIRSALRRARSHPPAHPVVPASSLAGYADAPLVQKLAIKPGTIVALLGAPRGFEQSLQPLPDGVRLRRDARTRRDLTIWFVRSRRELARRIDMLSKVQNGRLWIAWPKKESNIAADVGPASVREAGLTRGLVDYKICAIDETWSALLFSARKRKTRS